MQQYRTEKGTTAHLKDDSVDMEGTDPSAVDPILDAFKKHYDEAGARLVVTSAADGTHSQGSHHYPENTPAGRGAWAIDLRTWAYTPAEAKRIATKVDAQLGSDYDVIYEEDPQHFHGEKDVA